MNNSFQVVALPDEQREKILSMSDEQLRAIGGRRITVDAKPGFPCRASLEDAEIGEQVVALSYEYHDVDSPYQSSGPIFVRESAETAQLAINEIPEMLLARDQSLRAYDNQAMMIDADTATQENLAEKIRALFQNNAVSYLHVHNSKPGCFNCKIVRA